MQRTGANSFSFLAVLFFIASIVLRFFMLLSSLPSVINVVFYSLLIISVVMAGLSLKPQNNLSNAFKIKDSGRISAMGFVASVGFFIDFVHQCVVIFRKIDTESYRNLIQFIPVCFLCLFSIISCFYFFCMAFSFKNDSYDFRKLKLLHIAPLLWSITYVLTVLSVAIKPYKDVSSMLKYGALLFLVCFLYFFALEIENDNSTNKLMLVFAKGFSIISFSFFVDKALSTIINHSSALSDDNIVALSLLMICFFVFSFEREIVRNSNSSKGV